MQERGALMKEEKWEGKVLSVRTTRRNACVRSTVQEGNKMEEDKLLKTLQGK